MINALQKILNPIVKSFPLIGDQVEATVPFLVFTADPEPLRTKDGIIGYNYTVNITLVDNLISRIETNTEAIEKALELLIKPADSKVKIPVEVEGTMIEDILLQDETGTYFNVKTRTYQNDIEYRFDTENK